MVTCFRLECSDGYGIFKIRKDGLNLKELSIGDSIRRAHYSFPIPTEDKGCEGFTDRHYCAYKSIESLLGWIHPEELKILFQFGVKAYYLILKEALIGEYQICFKSKHIMFKKDITDLL